MFKKKPSLDDEDGDEPTFQKIPKKKKPSRFAMPGEAEGNKRKAVPRGQPFSHDDSLPKWSAR